MSNEPTRVALHAALDGATQYLQNLDQRAVAPTVDLATLRRRLAKPLADEGLPPEVVISQLIRDCDGGIMGSAGGRFFGWAIGGALPSAIAADWLVSAWDQNAALYSCGPAAAVVEEVVGVWLKELLNLPAHASFALTTGCQMAHMTCLAAARHHLLARRGWDVEKDGLFAAPPMRVIANNQRHGSIERAIRVLGIGTACIADLPTDKEARVLPEALKTVLEDDVHIPTIVLLNAGDFHTGAFDAFPHLIPMAHERDAWVHIDGAFGLWASASPRFAPLLAGAEQADSWAVDGHKWLNVPFDSGYAFVASPEAHRAAMSHRAAYLTHDLKARDQIDWNPEWSRRARGFPTYAALRQLGKRGVAELIERCCQHTKAFVDGVRNLPGVEVLSEPIINQAVVSFRDLRCGATERDHDRVTDNVIGAVAKSGEAFFTGTTWYRRRAMRVSVCNWRTDQADITRAVTALYRILALQAVTAQV